MATLVGVPAGVDQDGIGIKSVCLNGIDEFAFDIGLKTDDFHAMRLPESNPTRLQVLQDLMAVHTRLPGAQQIQIGPFKMAMRFTLQS